MRTGVRSAGRRSPQVAARITHGGSAMSADTSNSRPASAIEGVTQEWQEEHPAGAFVRWMPQMEASQAEIIARIIEAAGIKPGMEVLDIGSGGGVPALKLAEVVGQNGRVVA